MKKSLFVLAVLLMVIAFAPQAKAAELAQKLKGKILLQVENKGAAWYVNPANAKRYSMGKPGEAFALMRQLGVGINNANLMKIPVADANFDGSDSDGDGLSDVIEEAIGSNKNKVDTDGDGYQDKDEFLQGYSVIVAGGNKVIDPDFAKKHYGKIFLQVESKGEAWYVSPTDGKRYFLRRPNDAFDIMRNLGLGISNNDLNKISVNNQTAVETTKQIALPKGAAKLKFVNAVTGKAVPGHMIYCSECVDVSTQNPAESDLNGEIVLTPKSNEIVSAGKFRIDWHDYDMINKIKPGETRIIKMTPHVVGADDKIYFPETTYAKNPENKTQLHVVYKGINGQPVVKDFVHAYGALKNGRVMVSGLTDSSGKATVDLPTSGAYRIVAKIGDSAGQSFFQVEAMTGYNIYLNLDLSKVDQMTSGTEALSKDYKERGLILVCVREEGTNKPVSATVMIPYSNILITSSVKHGSDICVEVPKGYEKIAIPAGGGYQGHGEVSTSEADSDGILYLYVTANK